MSLSERGITEETMGIYQGVVGLKQIPRVSIREGGYRRDHGSLSEGVATKETTSLYWGGGGATEETMGLY